MTETRKLAAILAADVVGFSWLAGADEDRTLARLRALRSDLIDPTIAVHKGRVVKRTGDGAIVEFRSVVDAVRCALEVQNAMVERNSGVPEDRRIEFRIGVHLGDVVEEDDGDLMGDGVNIAARLEGIAKPGTICLSEDAYRQVPALRLRLRERRRRFPGSAKAPEEASVEKRAHLADRELQAVLRARDLAPLDNRAQYYIAMGYYATCQADRVQVEAEKAAALNPYDASMLGSLALWVAFTGHWDEGNALAEKAIKLAGPSAVPYWWWPKAKRAWFRGDYPEAYEAFQRAYIESFWLSHLDLAYTLPFLGRVDEAKQHVAALLKMHPTMTIREADAFYKLICFDPAFREKMVGALRQAGLPE